MSTKTLPNDTIRIETESSWILFSGIRKFWGLSMKIILGVSAVTLFAAFMAANEVAQHSADHLQDTQNESVNLIENGVEVVNRDLKAITAYVSNVEDNDPQLFGAFIAELKNQGLCAFSLVGIGAKPLSDIHATEFSHGKISDIELRKVVDSPEFQHAIEVAMKSESSSMTAGFRGLIEKNWTDLVAFVSLITNPEGEQQIVYAIHDSQRLVGELISDDPSTHGVGAYSINVTDVRDGSTIGTTTFHDAKDGDALTIEASLASVLNSFWSVRVSAPKNYALLRSDRAAVLAVLLGGFAVAWILVTIAQAMARKQTGLKDRAQIAESRYSDQIGLTSRLAANSQVVLEAATDAILLVDQNRNIVWINEAFRSLFEVEDNNWSGRNSSELKTHIADVENLPDGYHSEIDAIYRDEQFTEQSKIIKISKSEGHSFVSRSTVPVEDVDGSYIGRLWIYRDVTDVQELADARSRLVSVVSHELRTPLTTVKGHIDLLSDGLLGDMPSKQSKSITAASKALDRLGVLIDDLLDLSRIDSDALAIDYEVIPAKVLVENLVEEFRLRFESSDIELRTELNADGDIWCDPYRYSQIIANLLSNAERYTPEGGTVTVTARFEATDFIVVVSDTGIGIPESKIDQIFDPFITASVVSYKKEGSTGLGLAIVRGLTELHGGTVTVASTTGIGSTFIVSIPVTPMDGSAIWLAAGTDTRTL